MWHASGRREERILIQVSALPERPQPVLCVEEPLHIGWLPSKRLLQLLPQHETPCNWRICFTANAIQGNSPKKAIAKPW